MTTRDQKQIDTVGYPMTLIGPKLFSLLSVKLIQISRITCNKYELFIMVNRNFCETLIRDCFYLLSHRCFDIIILYNATAGDHLKEFVVCGYSD
jgi:hypothetical protein